MRHWLIEGLVAFNVFKGKVKSSVTDGQMLARVLLAQLKAVEPPARADSAAAE